jgi:hypothetical protein
MSRAKRIAIIAPLAIVGLILFAFIGGKIVQLLWNWLTPSLFGWHAITFWQGLGLLVLCRILFGGHMFRGGPPSRIRERFRERMRARWGNMTPEERERFHQKMRERCGWGRPADERSEQQRL